MSASFIDKIVCTIGTGNTESNTITSKVYHDAAAIGIISPAALDAGTYVIEVNTAIDGSGAWARLIDRDGSDTAVPAAASAMWYPELVNYPAFRIRNSAATVAATDRVFTVLKHWTSN